MLTFYTAMKKYGKTAEEIKHRRATQWEGYSKDGLLHLNGSTTRVIYSLNSTHIERHFFVSNFCRNCPFCTCFCRLLHPVVATMYIAVVSNYSLVDYRHTSCTLDMTNMFGGRTVHRNHHPTSTRSFPPSSLTPLLTSIPTT